MDSNNLNYTQLKRRFQEISEQLTAIEPDNPLMNHINKYPLPSQEEIIAILEDILDVIFPGYYTNKEINEFNIKSFVDMRLNRIYEKLSIEIKKTLLLEHYSQKLCDFCSSCEDEAQTITLKLLEQLDNVRQLVAKDVKAAFDGDPAAKNYSEVILSYPSIFAVTIHRIANVLYKLGVSYIPRIMSEYSHRQTGIDIHPGATIGEYFFIDHGTGVVIGETCEIGNNVKLYQGVTLGALSFPRDEDGNIIKGKKRHPKIEDNVTIYAGATILGGDTVIGECSVVGGNTWIVSSLPRCSRVSVDFSQLNSVSKKGSCC